MYINSNVRTDGMRVIAGKAKRLKLMAPQGQHVRPTTDRIKETLFNIIGNQLIDVRFLDLFSGSGAIGIEALSRGAKQCTFVDNNDKAVNCLMQNLAHTRLSDHAELIKKEVCNTIEELYNKKRLYEIIFLDPPYHQGWEEKALTALNKYSLLTAGGIIICESALETSFDFVKHLSFEITREKRFNINKFTFISQR